jgi:uncharacterized protein (TIGR00255 family)
MLYCLFFIRFFNGLEVLEMVASMTGFGRGRAESSQFSVTAEIKSVNHRFCEFHIRMPRQLLKIEDKIKKKLAETIQRGRVEVYITIGGSGAITRKVMVDWDLLDEYYQYIEKIKERYKLTADVPLKAILERDEIIMIEEVESENEELEKLVLAAVEEAALDLNKMRQSEGEALEKDVYKYLNQLSDRIQAVENLAPTVVEHYRKRLQKRMEDLRAGEIDEARILTETAIFADKADISEEIARLKSHILQFERTVKLHEPVGRKLDFLVQEMNREVNTIGSKANDSHIANEVVEMKSLLEKMKEQLQNIE